ncbi:3'(2'),5'-bisphosphate nucleotidase CysQ [Polymorphobacter sp.]|uniref:3'(2'),5'-bisphosphate nucleotidase CysQ n=1 Tax=Polymorphobacter sp. TaxID=1909290 RepID=UPI003F7256DC
MSDDGALARDLAEAAGALLLAVRARGGEARAMGDAGDREANALIMARLAEARPDDGVLSEESVDTAARLGRRRVWIIDPLDGTREYGEGRDDWAVHVGLSIDGRAAAGAVALPALGRCHDTASAVLAPGGDGLRMVVSRSRVPAIAAPVAAAIGAEMVAMGSAGAKAMAVLEGRAGVYLHEGGQHQWDNCAPVAVALAAGLHCSRTDGSPLVYNGAETWTPDLLICRPELAETVLAAIARLR